MMSVSFLILLNFGSSKFSFLLRANFPQSVLSVLLLLPSAPHDSIFFHRFQIGYLFL